MEKTVEKVLLGHVKRKARLSLAKCVEIMWEMFSLDEKAEETTRLFVQAMTYHHQLLETLAILEGIEDPLPREEMVS